MIESEFVSLRSFIAVLPAKACDMTIIFRYGTFELSPQVMQERSFECGSVGCIKGWMQIKLTLEGREDFSPDSVLGLGGEESGILFFEFPVADIRWKDWMLARLDQIIKTGQISDWRHIPELNPEYFRAIRSS